MTAARELILDVFLNLERHVTAEQVWEAALKIDPRIGQATVFRTMRLFAEAGLAREARTAVGGMQWEHSYRHQHHDHLVCVVCGKVLEFHDDVVEKAQEAIYQSYGYESVSHKLELLGRCPACQRKGRSSRKTSSRDSGK